MLKNVGMLRLRRCKMRGRQLKISKAKSNLSTAKIF